MTPQGETTFTAPSVERVRTDIRAMTNVVDRLLHVMATLRDPDAGCEWDRQQTFETIAPYTIEEAYEVADAIERGAIDELKEELGDLLLQVVFHSRIAEELGHFNFRDVVEAIVTKMEERHPHIFDSAGGTMIATRWEDLKAAERDRKGTSSSMDGVARALPALLRAEKLQKRAARDGFDWQSEEGPRQKIQEELEELARAGCDTVEEEAGDLLFAVVNLLRYRGIAAEDALRSGNAKFERRYRAMEDLAGGSIADLEIEAQERLWRKVKRGEGS